MSDTRTRPSCGQDGPAVVLDLDEARAARPAGASRLARLGGLQVQDVGRTVRVQALERIARR